MFNFFDTIQEYIFVNEDIKNENKVIKQKVKKKKLFRSKSFNGFLNKKKDQINNLEYKIDKLNDKLEEAKGKINQFSIINELQREANRSLGIILSSILSGILLYKLYNYE